MREAIKQWWEAQAKEMAKRPAQSFENKDYRLNADTYAGALAGLEKGIEIAEGFAEFCMEKYIAIRIANGHEFVFIQPGNPQHKFTTSQLLEKYIKTLK